MDMNRRNFLASLVPYVVVLGATATFLAEEPKKIVPIKFQERIPPTEFSKVEMFGLMYGMGAKKLAELDFDRTYSLRYSDGSIVHGVHFIKYPQATRPPKRLFAKK